MLIGPIIFSFIITDNNDYKNFLTPRLKFFVQGLLINDPNLSLKAIQSVSDDELIKVITIHTASIVINKI